MTKIEHQDSDVGYVTYTNEDGPCWLTDYTVETGAFQTGPYRGRNAIAYEYFRKIEEGAEASRKNDCPDNGFFGIYQLRFVPCTHEEAHEQSIHAQAWVSECEAHDEAYDARMRELYGNDWDCEPAGYDESTNPGNGWRSPL